MQIEEKLHEPLKGKFSITIVSKISESDMCDMYIWSKLKTVRDSPFQIDALRVHTVSLKVHFEFCDFAN